MTLRLLLAVVAVTLMGVAQTAHATLFNYYAVLDGPSEAPPNASPATGYALVEYEDTLHTLHVSASFSGLTTGNTAAHIHAATAAPFAGTAGVATPTPTFPGFPTGATSGTYDQTLDLTLPSSFRVGFLTANGGTPASAEAALAAAMAEGKAYFNIHTSTYPGGEIRGFLQPVPEPGSLVLAGLGLAGLAGRKLRRRRSSPAA